MVKPLGVQAREEMVVVSVVEVEVVVIQYIKNFPSLACSLSFVLSTSGDLSSFPVLVCHRVDHESPPFSLSTCCSCAWAVAGHVADCRCRDCCCCRRDKEQFWISFVGL